jgi:MFS family permease
MRKPSLLIIFLTVFIDLIGFGIVLPLLPRYSELYGAEGGMIGLIVASFSVMQLVFAPAWGRWSDRIGRRPVLLISNAGSVVSYAIFALSAWPGLSTGAALTLLLGSRVFAGVCGANISVASAYIADITPPEERSKGMGLIGMSFGLGFILGPVLGAFSAKLFGLQGPGWTAAALCAFNLTLASLILSESRTPGATPATLRPGLSQWIHTLQRPVAGLLVGLYFLAVFAFACFESTLPLLLGSCSFHPDEFQRPAETIARIAWGREPVPAHLRGLLTPEARGRLEAAAQEGKHTAQVALFKEINPLLRSTNLYAPAAWSGVPLREETRSLAGGDRSGGRLQRFNRLLLEDAFPEALERQRFYYDETRIGYLFAFCGLVSAFVQGGMIGRLVKRFGEPKLIVASLIGVGVSLALLPYAGTLTWLLLALALISAGSGINRAPTLGLLSILTPAAEQGATLGVAQSAGTLGRIFGPLFATSIYALYPHAPYLAAAAICILTAGIAVRFLKRPPTDRPA